VTMLVGDARAMVAENLRSLASLRAIVGRMADKPDISAHEGIVSRQQEPSKFGVAFYYSGARDAELREALSHVRPVFRRQVREIELLALRDFTSACDETIKRIFRRVG
jgi:hypothetical protein